MERLQKWFGGGDIRSLEPRLLTESGVSIVKRDAASVMSSMSAEEHVKGRTEEKTLQKPIASQLVESEQPDIPSNASVTETRVGQLLNQGREMILRVVPLAEGDCLSCKLIGSGAMFGAAAFILFSYPKMKTRYTGWKRTLCVLQVGSLSTGLALLGVARFFDLSVFSPADAQGNKKSVGQMLTEDMDSVRQFSSQLFSSNRSSDSKKDS
ncbi:uncharacterized protein LOC143281732 [Babylonia areolata]|uniref:uncharacterized protein LOC143281732 n=1 Tax=Babylonia areolata TaxID=304850 RepID=UPI003FCF6129